LERDLDLDFFTDLDLDLDLDLDRDLDLDFLGLPGFLLGDILFLDLDFGILLYIYKKNN
tara:strand:- start:311 stop:487 length:177 start_codon:yes stop_codon:yes gene_type:complete